VTEELAGETRGACAAFTFLTRLPLGPFALHDPADLPRSAAYFPVVGLVVGLLGAAAYAVGARFWTPVLGAVLSTITTVLATGAFHEDALADALDGFGGGWSRDQILTIMKDSRVGSYALIGTVLAVAAKLAALTAIADTSDNVGVMRALVAGHVLGRWSGTLLIRMLPYVRPTNDSVRPSAGQPFVASISNRRLAYATMIAVLLVVTALVWQSVSAIIVAATVTLLAARYFAERLGGVTGDALGAANQIVEVCVYLALAAHVA